MSQQTVNLNPFGKGCKAAQQLLSQFSNPYEEDTEDFHRWNAGFRAQTMDFIDELKVGDNY